MCPPPLSVTGSAGRLSGGASACLLYHDEVMLESPWDEAGGQGPHPVIRGLEHPVPPPDLWEGRRAGVQSITHGQ